MSSVKWYRVVDPLNPLCGCDVRLGKDEGETYHKLAVFSEDTGGGEYVSVCAVRRLDVLIGDRPFQLVNPDGDIGVLVNKEHLEPSPVQDDVVEIAYDLPHGKCLDESTLAVDGDELRIVTYERAIQVAYGETDGELYATSTMRGDDRGERLYDLTAAFKNTNLGHEDIVALVKRENY